MFHVYVCARIHIYCLNTWLVIDSQPLQLNLYLFLHLVLSRPFLFSPQPKGQGRWASSRGVGLLQMFSHYGFFPGARPCMLSLKASDVFECVLLPLQIQVDWLTKHPSSCYNRTHFIKSSKLDFWIHLGVCSNVALNGKVGLHHQHCMHGEIVMLSVCTDKD